MIEKMAIDQLFEGKKFDPYCPIFNLLSCESQVKLSAHAQTHLHGKSQKKAGIYVYYHESRMALQMYDENNSLKTLTVIQNERTFILL